MDMWFLHGAKLVVSNQLSPQRLNELKQVASWVLRHFKSCRLKASTRGTLWKTLTEGVITKVMKAVRDTEGRNKEKARATHNRSLLWAQKSFSTRVSTHLRSIVSNTCSILGVASWVGCFVSRSFLGLPLHESPHLRSDSELLLPWYALARATTKEFPIPKSRLTLLKL